MNQTVQKDTIERSILINAPIERVWSFVSKTGWWVGEEVHFDVTAQQGETIPVSGGKWGQFPVRVEKLDPTSYAAFRWASAYGGADLTPTNSTLVEFRLAPTADGVRVDVRESGFANLEGEHAFIADQLAGNTEGWAMQMTALLEAITTATA
ncbi:MAG TPA: SRPBCC domain-containing protein [Thermomicrobiales bacterium]|nr:SRPBCC domain-containing protein [Thermomicrobiales bacterium]